MLHRCLMLRHVRGCEVKQKTEKVRKNKETKKRKRNQGLKAKWKNLQTITGLTRTTVINLFYFFHLIIRIFFCSSSWRTTPSKCSWTSRCFARKNCFKSGWKILIDYRHRFWLILLFPIKRLLVLLIAPSGRSLVSNRAI